MTVHKHILGSIIGAAALALSLVSCIKENSASTGDMEIVNGELTSFSGAIDEEFTKAYANAASTGVVTWENGDRIVVSAGGPNTQIFEYNSSTQKFVHTEANGVKDNGIGFVMIYPADIFTDADIAGNTFTVHVNLPATQTLKDRNSCNKPPMMANCAPLASGNSGKVKFKSICGILGFSVTGDVDKGNFASVSFKGAGACGAGTLTCTGGIGSSLVPNLTMTDDSTEKTVTITDTGTTSETTPVWYYMYLPPKTYTSPKITVTFADGNVAAVDRTVASLPISRNNISWSANYFQTIFSGGGAAGAQSGTAEAPYLIKTENDLRELAAKVNGTNVSYSSAPSNLSSALSGHSSAAEESSSPNAKIPTATLSKSGVTYNTSGKYFKIVNNITLTSGFTPIGTDANPFQGIIVGNGRTISGLSVTGASANRGLFGVLSGATVSNLTISGPSVTGGTSFVGALAGKAINSTIKSVTVSGGTVSGSGNSIGGIVGLLNGGSLGASDGACSTTCAVSGASFIGGVVGAASAGTISHCSHATGGVSASGQHVGGVLGSLCAFTDGAATYAASSASISDCSLSSGTVSNTRTDNGNGYVGGVIGSTYSGAVDRCSTTGGTVSASKSSIVGGVIGEVCGGAVMQGTSSGSRSSNAASVTGYDYTGGVCGKVWSGTLRYYNNNNGSVTGHSNVGGITGGTGNGGACNVNYCTNSRAVSGLSNLGGVAGAFGSSTDATYTHGISNCSNSGAVTTTNATATNTISLGGCVGLSQANGTVSSCSNSYAISTKGCSVGGIVGNVAGPSIISSCSHSAGVVSTGSCVGGIAGNIGSTSATVEGQISGCNITNGSQTIQGNRHIGGIVGLLCSTKSSSVYNCVVNAGVTITSTSTSSGPSGSGITGNDVKNSCVGGIAGSMFGKTEIVYCCTKGCTVSGFAGVGGIVGGVYGKYVKDTDERRPYINLCSSTANCSAGDPNINRLGGIAGYCEHVCVIRNTVRCGGTLTCNFTATGAGPIAGVGGIVGQIYHGGYWGVSGTAYVQNCQVNSTLVTLPAGSPGGVGGIVGVVTGDNTYPTTCNTHNCYIVFGNSNTSRFFRVRVGASTYVDNSHFATYGVGPVFGYNTGGKHSIRRVFWGSNCLPGNLTTSGKVTCKDIYDGVTTGNKGFGTGNESQAYKTAYDPDYCSGKAYLGTLTRSYTGEKTIIEHLNYSATGNTPPSNATTWSTNNAYGGVNDNSQKLASPNDVKY